MPLQALLSLTDPSFWDVMHTLQRMKMNWLQMRTDGAATASSITQMSSLVLAELKDFQNKASSILAFVDRPTSLRERLQASLLAIHAHSFRADVLRYQSVSMAAEPALRTSSFIAMTEDLQGLIKAYLKIGLLAPIMARSWIVLHHVLSSGFVLAGIELRLGVDTSCALIEKLIDLISVNTVAGGIERPSSSQGPPFAPSLEFLRQLIRR